MEARGKEALWLQKKPEVLKALRELAIIQSAESSNRIEGIIVEPRRLRPLLLQHTHPKERPEEELVGYRKALDWIHKEYKNIELQPKTILYLHKLIQGNLSGDSGKWKTKDNEIIELFPDGKRHIRFKALSAKETSKAIQELCLGYHHICEQKELPELLAIATCIFDFLCIHPFRDGNGRISRLLTLLLLYQHNFLIGRYISLERITEETKESYYKSLSLSSEGWHQGKHTLIPWWNYCLSTLKEAYIEFSQRMDISESIGGKGTMVQQTILQQQTSFNLAELQVLCPSVSVQLIKKILLQLKHEKKITLSGRGRGAKWKVK